MRDSNLLFFAMRAARNNVKRAAKNADERRRWKWAGPVACVLIAAGIVFLGWGW